MKGMYSNILVAIAPDHGPPQEKALDVALHMARDADAEITALTAVEPISAYVPDRAEAMLDEHAGERAMASLRNMVGPRSEIRTRIVHKSAAVAILDAAEEIGADCIVSYVEFDDGDFTNDSRAKFRERSISFGITP